MSLENLLAIKRLARHEASAEAALLKLVKGRVKERWPGA